jgi:hypothetical protein
MIRLAEAVRTGNVIEMPSDEKKWNVKERNRPEKRQK